jgi:chromosome segregation ATPase
MNAILREEYEAPVLTIEAIEVHLSYMRPGLDAVQAALPVLRDKIDDLCADLGTRIDQLAARSDAKFEQLDAKIERLAATTDAKIDRLDAKIDQLAARTDAKIDQLAARTDAKIDQLAAATDAKIDQLAAGTNAKIDEANKDRAAGDSLLAGKIDHLTERVLEMQGTQKGLMWFIGSVTVIATVIGVGVSIAHTFGWI